MEVSFLHDSAIIKSGSESGAKAYWNQHHLPDETRSASVELLNNYLSDIIDLGLQAKQAHWNIKGAQFSSLHALFDEIAMEAGRMADELAERVISIGGTALGTVQVIYSQTHLNPYPIAAQSAREHIDAIIAALSLLAKSTHDALAVSNHLGDAVSADVFTQILRTLDKLLWKVEAHVV